MRHAPLAAAIAFLSACAAPAPAPPPPPSPGPQASATEAPRGRNGRSSMCDSPPIGRHRAGQGAPVSITMNNDGGWCGKGLARLTRMPFDRGDVTSPPRHGEVRVRQGGQASFVEYRPEPGFTGTDGFSVTMYPNASPYLFDVTVRP